MPRVALRAAADAELSHLHLGQTLGWWHRTVEVPSWFQEGLADWVADTGDEQVSLREVRDAIVGGNSIVLEESGNFPFPTRPDSYGMTWPMFPMQSRMFVEYLRSRDANAFRRFVAAVVRGAGFKSAFQDHYGAELSDAWKDFVQSTDAWPPGAFRRGAPEVGAYRADGRRSIGSVRGRRETDGR